MWAPPPAVANQALAELAKSRLKRPYQVTHVFICPRLLWQEEWRRRFEKEMDFWFILHPGIAWPHSNFEPLLIGLSFPMSRTRPWLVRQLREQVVKAGRALSKVSKICHLQVRDYLRKIWLHLREVLLVPWGVVGVCVSPDLADCSRRTRTRLKAVRHPAQHWC